jgi:hypothetical protein
MADKGIKKVEVSDCVDFSNDLKHKYKKKTGKQIESLKVLSLSSA